MFKVNTFTHMWCHIKSCNCLFSRYRYFILEDIRAMLFSECQRTSFYMIMV